jgi:hypothetical protein
MEEDAGEVRHRGARRAAARPTGGRAGEGGEESRRAERTRNGAGDLDLKWERQERENEGLNGVNGGGGEKGRYFLARAIWSNLTHELSGPVQLPA